jgi:hypothetical protein
LFWKRKKDKKTDLPFGLEYDEDKRAYYRVAPKTDEPLFLKAGGKRYSVVDVSAGGVAFEGAGFVPGDIVSGVLTMPPGSPSIAVALTIVKRVSGNVVAAQFKKIKDEDREQVHFYVLKRQKEELDQQRKLNKIEKPHDGSSADESPEGDG